MLDAFAADQQMGRGETGDYPVPHQPSGVRSQYDRADLSRWQIEIFFKSLKQLLRVKTFVGTSSKALHVQIWTALISMLILKYLQMRSQFGWSLSHLVALLRQQLFVYRDLYRWIHNPFEAPPGLAGIHDVQLALDLG